MATKKIILFSAVILTLAAVVPAYGSGNGRVTGQATVELDSGSANIWARIFQNSESPDRRMFRYEYGNEKVFLHVHNLKFDGSYAWFSGQVTNESTTRQGQWLFVAVHDGGFVNHLWWQWLDGQEQAAKMVEDLEIPDRNLPIKSGNLTIENH